MVGTYSVEVVHKRDTVEPLYSRHHWDHSKCPYFRSFLILGVDFIHICKYLWQNQVSGFEGVWSEGFHCNLEGVACGSWHMYINVVQVLTFVKQ